MKFIVDVMLGPLARWLRLLGFDTVFAGESVKDKQLVQLAVKEQRVILTKDRELGMNERALLVSGAVIGEQLKFVVKTLGLKVVFPPGSRCSVCNGLLNSVLDSSREKEMVCASCGKHYWIGAHWKRIEKVVKSLQKVRKSRN